jgi:hypothetical protein
MPALLMTTAPNPHALSLNKAVVALHIAPRKGRLTLVMRKTYNVLLKLASDEWRTLPQTERARLILEMAEKKTLTPKMQVSPAFTFATQVGVILKALHLDRKNTKLIYAGLSELRSCKVEWNMMHDGGEMTFISGMLSEATIAPGGLITWSYGLNLFEMLMQPAVYQAIDLQLQTEFTRYSAQALYENAIRYSKMKSTGWKPELRWRELLSSDGSPTHESYRIWKSRTLARAIAEMNAAARCPITLTLEERTGLDCRKRELRFVIAPKPHQALFSETPIPHEKQLVAQLQAFGFDSKEIEDMLANHDPDYVAENLAYVAAQRERGMVRSLKAYIKKALAEDYRNPQLKAASAVAKIRKAKAIDAEATRLDDEFHEFQATRLREKFFALPRAEQLVRLHIYAGEKKLAADVEQLIRDEGLEVFHLDNYLGRSITGTFFAWLKLQQPALLSSPEETDKHAFAAVRA